MKIAILLITSLLFLGCQTATIKPSTPSVNIKQNQKISSPLLIEFKSNSVWFAHEGKLGTATLIDSDNNKLGVAILSVTDGNWMSEDPLTSNVTLNFKTKNSTSAKLIFRNNNPSTTEGVNKMFEINVLLTDMLVGDWYQTIPKENSIAFSLKEDGTAKSLTMATLLYKNYKRVGKDKIIFTIKSIGNGTSSTDEYLYFIESLSNDKMVLRYLDDGKKSKVKEIYIKSNKIKNRLK